MTLPLPGNKQCDRHHSTGNMGLRYNKFFDGWPEEIGGKIAPGKKQDWIRRFSKKTGDPEAYAHRLKALAENLGGRSDEFITTSPLVTGMGLSHPIENGFLWHHTYGFPYIPGSSIKGLIRAWVEYWSALHEGDSGYQAHIDEIWRLFGGPIVRYDEASKVKREIRPPSSGGILVFDAVPIAPVSLMAEVITPHDGGWRISTTADKPPADWIDPVPIPFLAIKEGAIFQFCLATRRGGEKEDLQNAFRYLTEALDWIGVGAKTAIGFGRFQNLSEAQAEKKAYLEDWLANLKDGDEAYFYGQHVIVTNIERNEGKVKLLAFETREPKKGRKDLAKLTPWEER